MKHPSVISRICSFLASIRSRIQPHGIKTEQGFTATWTPILQSDAKLYNGLYNSLQQAADGYAKKPEKVLKEWSNRTVYKWEGSTIAKLCASTLQPAYESADAQECQKWARLLMQAVKNANITPQKETTLVLDDASVKAYIDWDGAALYAGDTIEVIHPAWYQHGQLLEQGHCHLRQVQK